MIESSPRVHRHCGSVGAAEVPFCGCRADGAQLAANGSHATMVAKACYVVDIYWTGEVRASETLSIAKWKCLSAFRTWLSRVCVGVVRAREGRDGRAEDGWFASVPRNRSAEWSLGFCLVAMLSLIRCAGKMARIAAGCVGCGVEGRVCNV